jgi:two-component system OmpR family sensor kinase
LVRPPFPQHTVNEAYDYALQQAATRLLPLALHDIREPHEQRRRVEGLSENESDFSYVVRDSGGNIVLNAGAVPEAMLPEITADGYFDTNVGRAFALTDRRTGIGIVIFESENERTEASLDGTLALLGPLVALLPLVAVGVWFALRLALAPLRRLRSSLAQRDRYNLGPLHPESYPPELSPIVAEIESLLGRLQKALDAERAFAASSAHELRTPIAGALAQTQLLAGELKDHPAAQRTAEVERALRRLSSLSERLLQFARIEAGFARSDVEVDLLQIVSLIIRDFEAIGVHIELEVADGAKPRGYVNPDAFALVLRNLIDNAARHGAPGAPIRLRITEDGTMAIINDGPVVGAETLANLGRPFMRGETTSTGTGIGLSIARSVVEQTGGTFVLLSPASTADGGFEARIRF